MKIIADTHTHTIASTHAYSTLQEMVHAAAQKGLHAIAITDHGPAMPGAPQKGQWYFYNLHVVPDYLEGVRVLKGEETNVIDYEGNTDMEQVNLETLEWVVASMHQPCMPERAPTVEEVTNAWLNIAHTPYVNVIGHSGSERYRYDYERVIPEFGRNGKLVELNDSSFYNRVRSIHNCKTIMELCKKHRVPIIVNSDAHFSMKVGSLDHSLELLKEIDFPEELVVNSSVERFNRYLEDHSIRL